MVNEPFLNAGALAHVHTFHIIHIYAMPNYTETSYNRACEFCDFWHKVLFGSLQKSAPLQLRVYYVVRTVAKLRKCCNEKLLFYHGNELLKS